MTHSIRCKKSSFGDKRTRAFTFHLDRGIHLKSGIRFDILPFSIRRISFIPRTIFRCTKSFAENSDVRYLRNFFFYGHINVSRTPIRVKLFMQHGQTFEISMIIIHRSHMRCEINMEKKPSTGFMLRFRRRSTRMAKPHIRHCVTSSLHKSAPENYAHYNGDC